MKMPHRLDQNADSINLFVITNQHIPWLWTLIDQLAFDKAVHAADPSLKWSNKQLVNEIEGLVWFFLQNIKKQYFIQ